MAPTKFFSAGWSFYFGLASLLTDSHVFFTIWQLFNSKTNFSDAPKQSGKFSDG
jgi:hypothetical protein